MAGLQHFALESTKYTISTFNSNIYDIIEFYAVVCIYLYDNKKITAIVFEWQATLKQTEWQPVSTFIYKWLNLDVKIDWMEYVDGDEKSMS